MFLEMIISLTERASQKLFMITGGGIASIVSWVEFDVPRILLMMTLHEWVDFLLTVIVGSAVGWGIHTLLTFIKKKCKKRKSK